LSVKKLDLRELLEENIFQSKTRGVISMDAMHGILDRNRAGIHQE